MLFCAERVPFEQVIELDMIRFQSLLYTCTRLKAQRIVEDAWTNMTAAQGAVKDMKKHLKPWSEFLSPAQQKGLDDLIADFGGGF